MMPSELLDLCERQAAHGIELRFVTLTIPRRRVRSVRVRLFPGVLARVIGSNEKTLIVSAAMADIKRYLVKHLSNIEGYAVQFAEAGNHAEADRWLAEYVTLRDRLSTGGMWRSRV